MEVESTRSNLGKRGPSWRARNPKLMETPFVGNVRTFLFRKPFSGEPFVQLWGIYFGPKRPPPASLFLDWIHLKRARSLTASSHYPCTGLRCWHKIVTATYAIQRFLKLTVNPSSSTDFLQDKKQRPNNCDFPYKCIYIYTYIHISWLVQLPGSEYFRI